MNLPFRALKRALLQLGDSRVLGVLVTSLLLMLVLTGPFVAVFLLFAWLVELATPASLNLPWLGEVSFLGVLTRGLFSKTSWVFWTYVMAPVAMGITGLFLERVVAAVEARHYPQLPAIRPRPMSKSILYAIRFFALTAGVSFAALIVSFFSGFLAPAVYILSNGYLIAREYFETAALRRMDESRARALEKRARLALMLLGCALALALNLPFVNLLVPLVGIAAFTHVLHALIGTDGAPEVS